ncbi:related to SRR1-like protein BER1 [Saccharomycodes ludwigii]|uniref:Related to SRR1-like protein BER1 n=1 Tax=Saccharomycodes ludwigii TaxID=36035 RepID=A0A376B3N4_9ASCO|nr:related to SRR1-like protein BER1 [Saccharomycodes ludwigii]
MFEQLCKSLIPYKNKIQYIRCLALGSFHQDIHARYQLALLLELIDYFLEAPGSVQDTSNIKTLYISIYDPVFTDEDKKYIKNLGTTQTRNNIKLQYWTINKLNPWLDVPAYTNNDNINLFFLPHADLDLTESVFKLEFPMLFLANNLLVHTDRFTQKALFETFPAISKAVQYLPQKKNDKTKNTANKCNNDHDGFVMVQHTKNNNRNVRAKSRRQSQERFLKNNENPSEDLDYFSINSDINACSILCDFDKGNSLKDMPWMNSFSDLSLHILRTE